MTDFFSNQARSTSDPATMIFDITPDDGNDLPHVTTALNVATPGKVRVTVLDGSTSDLTIQPGHPFAIRVTRVWLTGTTATGVRGLV